MQNKVVLRIIDIVKSPHWISVSDAQRVQDRIRDAFKEGHSVELSFAGGKHLTSIFIKTAISQLYTEGRSEEFLKNNLHFVDITEFDRQLVTAVTESLVRYHAQQKAYDAAWTTLIGDKHPLVLDACCGSKMFWFDPDRKDVLFMDNRELEATLCDGRKLVIKPDVIGDFRKMPFLDSAFRMVVFDPPHLIHAGEDSWLAKKYGKLDPSTWKEDLAKGFNECLRVLQPLGTLIFKWSEDQVSVSEVLKLCPVKPLVGQRRGKTHWLVFMKEDTKEEPDDSIYADEN